MPEVKNTLNRINSSLNTHDEKVNKPEDKTIKTIHNMKLIQNIYYNVYTHICTNMCAYIKSIYMYTYV